MKTDNIKKKKERNKGKDKKAGGCERDESFNQNPLLFSNSLHCNPLKRDVLNEGYSNNG